MGKHRLEILEQPQDSAASGREPAPSAGGFLAGAMPSPSPEVEAERRRQLKKYKRIATGLLIMAAAIFLGCSWWQNQPGGAPIIVGYIRAAAEAGMVGGLADWFAVTALFRYPLGLRIPHTALVLNKKDQVGEQLSGFIGDNFLNAELITEKVSKANVAQKIGHWLAEPDNALKVSHEAGKLTANAVRAIKPADAEAVIQSQLIDRLAEPEWGPPAGRLLEGLIDDGKVEPVVDEIINWSHAKVLTMEDVVVTTIDERMPAWAPRFAKSLVGEKVYRELVNWATEVKFNKDHEARRAIRRGLSQFARDLQEDPAMVERVESIKRDIMGSTPVQGASAAMWKRLAAAIIGQAEDSTSMLRSKVASLCIEWGTNIQRDPQLRASLDRRIQSTVRFLADNYSGEVTSIISETVQRWDAEEASDKIELMVGKDLQYIRFNGTVVGALAGLVIYAVNHIIFGI